MTRGGHRPGAGRPPLEDGAKQVSVILTETLLAKLDEWAEWQGMNRSRALRRLIESLET